MLWLNSLFLSMIINLLRLKRHSFGSLHNKSMALPCSCSRYIRMINNWMNFEIMFKWFITNLRNILQSFFNIKKRPVDGRKLLSALDGRSLWLTCDARAAGCTWAWRWGYTIDHRIDINQVATVTMKVGGGGGGGGAGWGEGWRQSSMQVDRDVRK